jgi:hypothetical protein
MSQQDGPAAHARGGEGGLGTSVAASDHDHVESLREFHWEAGRILREGSTWNQRSRRRPLVPRETSDRAAAQQEVTVRQSIAPGSS